jgi:hypothetical protein
MVNNEDKLILGFYYMCVATAREARGLEEGRVAARQQPHVPGEEARAMAHVRRQPPT